MSSPIICANCGKENHYQRECKDPLTSYGLICYHRFIDDANKAKYKIIMIRRKDTIGYVEFLRGKYGVNDDDYIVKLINMMTNEEKTRIKEVMDFDKLRDILGMTRKNNLYKNEYESARMKFNILKNKIIEYECDNVKVKKRKLIFLINKSTSNWNETEWGLPKGRKHQKESNINCAIREFLEETGVNKDCINILMNVKPIVELYTSINDVSYRHIYYFAEYFEDKTDVFMNPNNKNQFIEISDINWFNKEDAIDLIRGYYPEKKNAIKKGFEIINSINEYCSII